MAKAKAKQKPAEPAAPERSAILGWAGWVLAAGAWLFVALALVSYHPADWPWIGVAVVHEKPENYCGWVGAFLAQKLLRLLGPGAWVLLAAALAVLGQRARGRRFAHPPLRVAGVLLLTVGAAGATRLAFPHAGVGPEGMAGLVALYLMEKLTASVNATGAALIVGLGLAIGAVLVADALLFRGLRSSGHCLARLLAAMPRRLPRSRLPRWRPAPAPAAAAAGISTAPGRKGGQAAKRQTKRREAAAASEAPDPEAATPPTAAGRSADEAEEAEPEAEPERVPAARAASDADEEAADADGAEAEAEDEEADVAETYVRENNFDPQRLREKIAKLPVNSAPRPQSAETPARQEDYSGYQFPELDVLEEPEDDFSEEQEEMVREQAVNLESALKEYRIEGEVVRIDSGPTITLYEVRLAPGTKSSRLNNVATDLARALKAHNVRIIPNMAGRDTVGIEVPNPKREKVRLKELMGADPEASERLGLPMWLGKDASGRPLIEDLASMPHMLIAGTTGSGKSVCMNTILMSFLFTKRPDELKLVLVDPKMVEMSMYRDIPHLACPVVTEMDKAAAILEWAVTRMNERYELLAEAGVRDVASYNALGWEELKERFEPATEEEEAKIPEKLPYTVFVIDELADLMMTHKEVEGHIVRIAQKARAVGMHLILATQRPQANVVTGLIKSNMPCRVAFKVSSGMDSRIVLDQKGGELLLGHGDMMFLNPKTTKIQRAQGTLVEDGEIRRTVKFLKKVAEPSYEPQLVQIRSGAAPAEEPAERDELFDSAVRIVLESKRGSVSLLQRRLAIGYARASRLIEQMADAGILGEYKGSQAREVNVSLEEYEAMLAQAEKDAAGGGGDDGGGVPAEMEGEHRG